MAEIKSAESYAQQISGLIQQAAIDGIIFDQITTEQFDAARGNLRINYSFHLSVDQDSFPDDEVIDHSTPDDATPGYLIIINDREFIFHGDDCDKPEWSIDEIIQKWAELEQLTFDMQDIKYVGFKLHEEDPWTKLVSDEDPVFALDTPHILRIKIHFTGLSE